MNRPNPNEYAEYYHKEIQLVPEGNIILFLDEQLKMMQNYFSTITEEKSLFRYAPEKWSIREVLGHIIDSERIHSYRALRFSRNDKKPLFSFNENDFIRESMYDKIPLPQLIEEFADIRKSNILMYKGFSEEMWLRKGIASDYEVRVRALAYIIAGHAEHHIRIIKERYL